jgi:assimilatory nitrate reductase catalytic subunit
VREDAIQAVLLQCPGDDAERLAALQGQLQCGTNCGSCVPELKRLVRSMAVLQPTS